jgi:thiamine-monophosphate kinase
VNINEIGGEFELIQRLSKLIPADNNEVVKGIGDDAAVLRIAPEPAPYLLVTTDMLVENHHFCRTWSAPEQIGVKAAECNLSDIAAMGGVPQWMFASISLPEDIDVAWVENMYRGIARSCQTHKVVLLGGDTTRGENITINITLLGRVEPDRLCLRSAARPGDLIMVTGTLGASAAGCALLNKGKQPSKYLMEKHLTPTCRLDISGQIAFHANAMIDISDGLGPETRHICTQSNVGARIYARDIPIHEEVRTAARLLRVDPLEWALSGGEDFELLFTIAPEKLDPLGTCKTALFKIGEITDAAAGIVLIESSGRAMGLPGGYDHFK